MPAHTTAEPSSTPPVSLHLSQDPEADALLSRDPLALLVGMVLDQQDKLEKAFRGPWVITQRTGRDLDARDLAERTDLREVFSTPPAVHRFPGSMADRVQALCRHLVEQHDGDAAAVWRDAPDGATLLRRVRALPGFGDQKARIFVALLGKQLGVRPPGWRDAAGDYALPGSRRSAADVVDQASLLEVRAFKSDAKKAARAAAPDVAAGGAGS